MKKIVTSPNGRFKSFLKQYPLSRNWTLLALSVTMCYLISFGKEQDEIHKNGNDYFCYMEFDFVV